MDKEQVTAIVEAAAAAVIRTVLATQVMTLADLMRTLAAKGVLSPAEVSAFGMRLADDCSKNLHPSAEGIAKAINDGLHFYVGELLKLSEHAISGAPHRSGGNPRRD
ncbi:hypothetical protein [Bradyrhizobium sp. SZCCHNRI2049]|uniref:hypothetical protein n=1 Tax=Bradyrhizobium sp. SZCCHNRI2049 TaxID=3057287 RepID=UPI0029164F25|nr:hypothetical protein [Bradyrhizobium sp. SZCCHNRI2049]